MSSYKPLATLNIILAGSLSVFEFEEKDVLIIVRIQ